MKNIQILVTLKAQVETADFMMEDLATFIDVEDVDLDELISEKDEDVLALLEQFKKIDCTLNMLTEDLRSSLCNEGFDCESYSTWVSELCYDLMRLTGLIESHIRCSTITLFTENLTKSARKNIRHIFL